MGVCQEGGGGLVGGELAACLLWGALLVAVLCIVLLACLFAGVLLMPGPLETTSSPYQPFRGMFCFWDGMCGTCLGRCNHGWSTSPSSPAQGDGGPRRRPSSPVSRGSVRYFWRQGGDWTQAHCSVLNGLIDSSLELRADFLSLGRRNVVVVASSELEHDSVPARLRSGLAAVDGEEVQGFCWTYSWAGRNSCPLLRRVRYGRTIIAAMVISVS